jgi:hypothetical protein
LAKALSREMDTGSREENASEQETLFALGIDLLLFVFVHFLDGRIVIGFPGGLGRRRRRRIARL